MNKINDYQDQLTKEHEQDSEYHEQLNENQEQQDLDDAFIIEEPLEDISSTHEKVNDEFSDHLDIVFNPTDLQTKTLASKASNQATDVMKKIEKCV